MSDENPGASGNRWEPTEPPTIEADTMPWLTRARAAIAGAAAAVLLVGGVGGFAIGRATAGTGDGAGRSGQQGVPAGFDRDGDGDGGGMGPGTGTGPGQPPQEQLPSDGVDDSQQDSGQQDDGGTDT